LVVDDFPDGREMLDEYLTFRGFRIVTAADGVEALAIARRNPPRLVLMDLSMPGVNGWEATRHLRADPLLRDVMVLAVTAHALSTDEGKALEAGADAFVAKPFDLAALADAIATIMAEGRSALHHVFPNSVTVAAHRQPAGT
jgi:CheY-like chemotaxis protein